MGMYDTVKFVCPNCQATISVENKKGEPGSAGWGSGTVPTATAKQLIDTDVLCDECFASFVIRPEAAAFLSLRLVPKE